MVGKNSISILGAGWLGLPLGAFLVEKGFRVNGSTTKTEKFPLLKAAGLQPFLLRADGQVSGETLPEFFASDILLLNMPPGRGREKVEETHPKEVRNVLELALSAGVKHLLFISSTGVYGDVNRIVTEADRPAPSRPSTRALAAVENFLQRQTAIKVTILRLAGLLGGERKAGRFLAGKKMVDHPDAPVNLVHRDDCINVIYEVIRQGKWGEIYNVCADEHPKKRDFYTDKALKEGLEAPSFRTGDPPAFKIISNEKLKFELGFVFKYPDPMSF